MKRTRTVALVLAGLWFANLGGAAGAPAVANEPPIELPKFEVVDSRVLPEPESWHYAAVPGFEILSNISERETRRFVRDFLLLQDAVQVVMPPLLNGRAGVPTALILTGKGKGFSEFIPTDQRETEYSRNSLFFENAERTAIVVDFALAELELDNTTRLEADPYRSFYAAYFRHLIRRQVGPDCPPWFEEGMVQLFSGIDFTRSWITFGQVGDGFGGAKSGDFNQLLAERALLPLDQMFSHEANGDAFWAAQCYAFVHYCLYGSNHRYTKPLYAFLTRLANEPPSEALFKQCFHCSYADMGVELRGHIEMTVQRYVQFRAKKGQALPEPPAVAIRDATQAEVGRLKGEVLRLAGHEQEAHLALIAPYIRGDKDPQLLAAVGLDELEARHDDRARKFLEVAVQQHVVRPRAYYELARLRYNGTMANLAPGTRISAAQADEVLAPLDAAAGQPPPLLGAFRLMLEVWNRSGTVPSRPQFERLLRGVQAFPGDPELLAGTALIASRAGFAKEAAALAERGTKLFARNDAQRQRFALLSDALARDAAQAENQKK